MTGAEKCQLIKLLTPGRFLPITHGSLGRLWCGNSGLPLPCTPLEPALPFLSLMAVCVLCKKPERTVPIIIKRLGPCFG